MMDTAVEAKQLDFYRKAGKSDGDPLEARQLDFYWKAGKID